MLLVLPFTSEGNAATLSVALRATVCEDCCFVLAGGLLLAEVVLLLATLAKVELLLLLDGTVDVRFFCCSIEEVLSAPFGGEGEDATIDALAPDDTLLRAANDGESTFDPITAVDDVGGGGGGVPFG